ncbi:MAG: hypothetical protein HQ564_08925 [Candidatus Saganbacteria bacterium]|nr:hypothetical protein [Candidatus Saganbacteria bacterium]
MQINGAKIITESLLKSKNIHSGGGLRLPLNLCANTISPLYRRQMDHISDSAIKVKLFGARVPTQKDLRLSFTAIRIVQSFSREDLLPQIRTVDNLFRLIRGVTIELRGIEDLPRDGKEVPEEIIAISKAIENFRVA